MEESRIKKSIFPSLNKIFLALIPKSERANSSRQFRPISLCNVIYKIISKVLANHMKPLLPLLILAHQMGYVEGRQIMDSIILSQEIIHTLKYQRKPGMLIQLDMSKYFDKINWRYIKLMLESFGFNTEIIKWIMALVSGALFSILLNRSPTSIINPS